METIFEQLNEPQQLRIKAFDKDLKNCLVFGSLLESYVGNLKPIRKEISQLRVKFHDKKDY
jgi:hypothetical protein